MGEAQVKKLIAVCSASHGGALVSKIHSHTSHGDPLVRKFMDQILEDVRSSCTFSRHMLTILKVSKPFLSTLQRWIFAGDLHDPFQEFFVQLNSDMSLRDGKISPFQTADVGFEGGMDAADGQDEAHKVWEKKYVFEKAMVPGFVSEDFGKKVRSSSSFQPTG